MGDNYFCCMPIESIINRLHFDYLAVLHGSHVFSIKRRYLGYQKFSDLSKYAELFENFYSMILISMNLFHCNLICLIRHIRFLRPL
jgi:hypothetical protein